MLEVYKFNIIKIFLAFVRMVAAEQDRNVPGAQRSEYRSGANVWEAGMPGKLKYLDEARCPFG